MRLGRIIHSTLDGHMVVEVMEAAATGLEATGFALVGPHASASLIYSSSEEALDALQDLEARLSGS